MQTLVSRFPQILLLFQNIRRPNLIRGKIYFFSNRQRKRWCISAPQKPPHETIDGPWLRQQDTVSLEFDPPDDSSRLHNRNLIAGHSDPRPRNLLRLGHWVPSTDAPLPRAMQPVRGNRSRYQRSRNLLATMEPFSPPSPIRGSRLRVSDMKVSVQKDC